jgi:hypothetical protein
MKLTPRAFGRIGLSWAEMPPEIKHKEIIAASTFVIIVVWLGLNKNKR